MTSTKAAKNNALASDSKALGVTKVVASETKMKAKLGIAPIAWSNDDLPELGGETTLETCLRESRAAGFSGVETGGKSVSLKSPR
jgi:hypothetical protein